MYRIIIVLFFSINNAFAQQAPAKLSLLGVGGDGNDHVASSAYRVDDDNFIIHLSTYSKPNTGNIGTLCAGDNKRQSVFRKYNATTLQVEWQTCYDNSGDSSVGFYFPAEQGSAVVAGVYTTAGSGYFIDKKDASGNIIWQRVHSRAAGHSLVDVIRTTDGGFMIAGHSYYSDTNATVHYGQFLTADILLIKLDSVGNKMWSRVLGGSDDDQVSKILNGPDSGFYVIGTTLSADHDCINSKGGGDVYVARLDKDGNTIWNGLPGGSGSEASYFACSNNKDGLIIAGATTSTDGDVHHHLSSNYNFWVLELDTASNIIWENCFGGGGYEFPRGVCKATDGNIWVIGKTTYTGGQIEVNYGRDDAWLLRIDSVGNYLSSMVLGSSSFDEGHLVYPLKNGGVMAGGYYLEKDNSFSTCSKYGGTDVFLGVFAPWNTGLKPIAALKKAVIYPNPVENSLHVKLVDNNAKSKNSLVIKDNSGKQVHKSWIAEDVAINTSRWAKGIYTVEIVSQKGERQVDAIVIR